MKKWSGENNALCPNASEKHNNAIDIKQKSLRIALLDYIEDESVKIEVAKEVASLINNRLLSNAQVASRVLAYKDKAINSQIKNWVLNHLDQKTAKVIEAAAKGACSEIFFNFLFENDHPEIYMPYLLLGETNLGIIDQMESFK